MSDENNEKWNEYWEEQKDFLAGTPFKRLIERIEELEKNQEVWATIDNVGSCHHLIENIESDIAELSNKIKRLEEELKK